MMAIKTIRYSKELTEVARNIFGDIVDKAYVTTWDINSDKYEVSPRLDEWGLVKSKDTEINYCGDTIWITFTNDTLVEFKNREWAYITLWNIANAYEA